MQINEYIQGKRKIFYLTLNLEGTEFQKNVWNELKNIPYGETRSYKDIAVAIGNETYLELLVWQIIKIQYQ